MNTLFTVFALGINILCTIAGYLIQCEWTHRAKESALRAEASEVRLKVMRSDTLALQAHVGRLDRTVDRLQGRVYATTRRPPPGDIAGGLMASDDPAARTVGATHDLLGVGESVAAKKECGCGWCQTCIERAARVFSTS